MGRACGLVRKACELFSLSACSQAPSSRVPTCGCSKHCSHPLVLSCCHALRLSCCHALMLSCSPAIIQIHIQIQIQMQMQVQLQVQIQIQIQAIKNQMQIPIQIPYQHVQNIAPRFLCWDNYLDSSYSVFGGCLWVPWGSVEIPTQIPTRIPIHN